jgi:hypothetical protein
VLALRHGWPSGIIVGVALSNRTITLLADAFFAGAGPSHRTLDRIWELNGAGGYLRPESEANKQDRVIYGLRWLRDGRPSGDPWSSPDLPPDDVRLRAVAGELAAELVATDAIDADALGEALRRDGLALHGDRLVDAEPAASRPRPAPVAPDTRPPTHVRRGGRLRRFFYDQWVIAIVAPLVVIGILALGGYAIAVGHLPFRGGAAEKPRTGLYAAELGGGPAVALGKVRITVRKLGGPPSPDVDYAVELLGEELPVLREQGQLVGDYVDYAGYRIQVNRIELPRRVIFEVTRR